MFESCLNFQFFLLLPVTLKTNYTCFVSVMLKEMYRQLNCVASFQECFWKYFTVQLLWLSSCSVTFITTPKMFDMMLFCFLSRYCIWLYHGLGQRVRRNQILIHTRSFWSWSQLLSSWVSHWIYRCWSSGGNQSDWEFLSPKQRRCATQWAKIFLVNYEMHQYQWRIFSISSEISG